MIVCALSSTCRELAEEKHDGPTAVVNFLSMTIDTDKGELRLPNKQAAQTARGDAAMAPEKVLHMPGTRVTDRHNAARLQRDYKPGIPFPKRIIALLGVAKRKHHHICLNNEFKADLDRWEVSARHRKGASLLINKVSPQVTLAPDASSDAGVVGRGTIHSGSNSMGSASKHRTGRS